MKVNVAFITLATSICIILINLLILSYSKNYYINLYKKHNIYSNFPDNNIDQKINTLIDYFRGNNYLEDKFFSYQAKIHLEDVRKLLKITIYITSTCLIFLFGSLVYLLINKKPQVFLKSVKYGTILTIVIVILLTIVAFLSFESFFSIFHKILFTNNYWLFDSSDNLIKLFPIDFFKSFAVQLIVNITLTSLALLFFVKLERYDK